MIDIRKLLEKKNVRVIVATESNWDCASRRDIDGKEMIWIQKRLNEEQIEYALALEYCMLCLTHGPHESRAMLSIFSWNSNVGLYSHARDMALKIVAQDVRESHINTMNYSRDGVVRRRRFWF